MRGICRIVCSSYVAMTDVDDQRPWILQNPYQMSFQLLNRMSLKPRMINAAANDSLYDTDKEQLGPQFLSYLLTE